MTNKYQCIQLRIQDFFLGGPLPTPPQKKNQQTTTTTTTNPQFQTTYIFLFTFHLFLPTNQWRIGYVISGRVCLMSNSHKSTIKIILLA